MSLRNELGLRTDFATPSHEAILSIYYTSACIRKRATAFFQQYGLTDVQFNLMMLLHYQCGEAGGLTQVELSRMMLVNRANITTLIDRMEKSDLVVRTPEPGDRRCNLVRLTPTGLRLLRKVEERYRQEVDRIMSPLSRSETANLNSMLARIRASLED